MAKNDPAYEVIRKIIDQWPFRPAQYDEVAKILSEYLSSDFKYVDFTVPINPKEAEILGGLEVNGIKKFIIHDPSPPKLALLVKEGGKWKLQLITYQCLTCFGNGIMFTGGPCDTCGGTGWGDLGEVEFCRGNEGT